MSNSQTDRDAIARKMRALAAKTVENGCTEEEALAAASLLSKLMEEYDLTMDEASMREQQFQRRDSKRGRPDDPIFPVLWKAANAIADLTHTRYWVVMPDEDRISFFGFEHEVAIAQYLLRICYSAMKGASDEHVAWFDVASRERKRRVFLEGMVERLAFRIREMIPKRPTGRGLIVLHNSLIDAELAKLGLKLEQARARTVDFDNASYAAGVYAGNSVALNPGVRGPSDDQRRLT